MTDAVSAPTPPGNPPPRDRRPGRWLRRLLWTGLVLVLLAAAAWWGVPALLQSQLPPRLSQALGRPVTLEAARFDPLRMQVGLQGLRIGPAAGASGPPLLEIDHIDADLGVWEALRYRAPVLEALTVDGLRARVAHTAQGRYDIDDLIARFSGPSEAEADSAPARFALYNLALRNAELQFDDRPKGRVHRVQALTLTLPFLSNLPAHVDIHTEPRLQFQLNGAAFDTGVQSLPFAATRSGDLRLSLTDLDLAFWAPYLPADLPLVLQKGRLDTRVQLHFTLPPQGHATLALTGRIGLRDVALAARDGRPVAAWQALAVDLRDVQPLARRVALGGLTVDGAVLDLQRDARGMLNLQRLLEVAPSTAGTAPQTATSASPSGTSAGASAASVAASGARTAPAPTAWALELDRLQLNGSQVRWRDETLRPAAAYTVADLSFQAGALRWPDPAPAKLALKAKLHAGAADGPLAASLAIEGEANHRQATLALALEAPDLGLLAPYAAAMLQPRPAGQFGATGQLRWAADPAALTLRLDDVTVTRLQLHPPSEGRQRRAAPLASLERLQATGVDLDLQAQRVGIERLQIDRPQAALARLADGTIDLRPWLPAATSPARGATRAPAAAAVTSPSASAESAAAAAVAAAASASSAASTAPAAQASDGTRPAWRLQLRDLALQGGRLSFTDAAVAPSGPPLQTEVANLRLRLQGLAWPAPADRRAALPRLQVSAEVGAPGAPGVTPERGRIDWTGTVGLAPLQADGRLTLARLPMHLFAPYVGDALPAALLHADGSLASQLRVVQMPGGWQVAADGDLQVTDLMLHTRPAPGDAAGSELLSWQALALQGVSARVAPGAKPKVAVREVALTDFFSRLVITEQGRFNLQDVAAAPAAAATASAPDQAAAAAAGPASAASAPTASADAGLPIDLEIGQTVLRNGRVDFSDRFVRPNYSARLTELNGTVGTIRSGTREMATISLRGRAADTALLDISGQINPTAQPLALDIRARATDLELAPLSPYAGKYAGYAIERGKLSMDVAYKIDADGRLEAKNQVILNQLTFGERVESPSATQLPVLLAVALLKDKNGVIDINLPVSGTLNDPQFSIGGIIWKVIVNLLTKALTAPFSLLAGGGADDLSQVQFTPGTARITEAGQQALQKVATALVDKPALQMTVTGAADTVSERDDARRSLLDERLTAEVRRERQRAAPPVQAGAAITSGPPAPLTAPPGPAAVAGSAPSGSAGAALPLTPPVTPAERAAALRRLYQQTPLPDRPRTALNQLKDLPPAEMEQRLLAGIVVSDDTMRELALQRGLAVRDALIARGLPTDRLFLAAPKLRLSGEGDAAWVPAVNLTLSTN